MCDVVGVVDNVCNVGFVEFDEVVVDCGLVLVGFVEKFENFCV